MRSRRRLFLLVFLPALGSCLFTTWLLYAKKMLGESINHENSIFKLDALRVSIKNEIKNTSNIHDVDEYHQEGNCYSVMKEYNISEKRSVMALSYWEQLTMATNSLCGLVNFARGWHARTVAPFTLNAEFYGLPSTVNYPTITGMPPIYKKDKTKPFGMLYNTDEFNSKLFCQKYRLSPLVSFEEFMRKADRRITLLHIDYFAVPPKSHFKGKHFVKCQRVKQIESVGYKLIRSLNIESDKRGLSHFTLHSACCIDHTHMIKKSQDIAEGCGFDNFDSLTAIFTVWRGYSDIPTKRFRLVTSISPLFAHPTPNKDLYPLSKEILQNASFFRHHLSGGAGREYVSIHLRTAKIAMMGKNAKSRFKRCFDKTQLTIKELVTTYSNVSLKFNYFVDYGRFGSHSYEVYLGQRASEPVLLSNKIHPVHYDPRTYGGKWDQGYVALVEQVALAHSKVLILVGGGSFQEQMKTRFIQTGYGERVYKICHTKEELVNLDYKK